MSWLLERLFGCRLKRETSSYLRQLAQAPILASRRQAREELAKLRAEDGPKITLGHTEWGEEVSVPLRLLVGSHGLVTGGTGAGKTQTSLIILNEVLKQAE
jgi:hypothetical protein